MRSIEELRHDVMTAIDARRDEIIALGDLLWKTPETGFREYKTSAIAVKKLEELGLKVKTGLAITGFAAELDSGRPGPTLALMGELDALIVPGHPEAVNGNAHSCGHNVQLAGLIAAAMGLVDAHAMDELSGKIRFIGTPAEEGIETEFRQGLIKEGKIRCINGKAELIYEGVFNDVDLAYMNHASMTSLGVFDHNGLVSKSVVFHGKSCHATAPAKGINPLNALDLARHAIAMWREELCNRDNGHIRVHGIINHGGEAVNVIPSECNLEYMLRAGTPELIKQLSEEFDRIVLHCAKAMNCKAEIATIQGYMPLLDNSAMCELYRKEIKYLYNKEAQIKTSFACSSTDMGDVASILPAIHGYVTGVAGCSHGTDYRIADKEIYLNAGKLPAGMALEMLYGDAAVGREIAADRGDLLSIDQYFELNKQFNSTVSTEDI